MTGHLIDVRSLAREGGADRALRLAAVRGDALRLHRGEYVARSDWQHLNLDERYLLRIRAIRDSAHAQPVFSTATFDTAVAVLDRGFSTAPLLADDALTVNRAQFREVLAERKGARGIRQARAAEAFADGRSRSTGESYSRLQMWRIGAPSPELQVEIIDLDGRTWHCDFGWRGVRQLGEFDGLVKYTRNQYLNGRSVADVVIEEKLREDAIRAASHSGMSRWVWDVARDLPRFERLLRSGGVFAESSRTFLP